VEDPKEAGEME